VTIFGIAGFAQIINTNNQGINMTTQSDKARQTIIDKYGDWETYLTIRYRSPEEAAKRSEAASKAGKASQASGNAVRPFTDKQKAREAQRLSVEAKRKK